MRKPPRKPWQGRGVEADEFKELTADCGCIFRCTPVYGPGSVKRLGGDKPPTPPVPVGWFWLRVEICEHHHNICISGLNRMMERSRRPIKPKVSICNEWMPWSNESRLDALNHVKSMGRTREALRIFRDINCISVHDECPIGSVECKVWCKASMRLRLTERLERIRRALKI